MSRTGGYKPQDRLFLSYLGQPDRPRLVGDLEAVRTSRGVSLRYDDAWLRDGFALSEDLPLLPQVFLPPQRDTAAGAVDDARPDRWGERVTRTPRSTTRCRCRRSFR
jgi:serine/threonine-protein kinase HipA